MIACCCTTTPPPPPPCDTLCAGGLTYDEAVVTVPQCGDVRAVGAYYCIKDLVISSQCVTCDGGTTYIEVSGFPFSLSLVTSDGGLTWTWTGGTILTYDNSGCMGSPISTDTITATLTLSVDGDGNLISGRLILTGAGLTFYDSGVIPGANFLCEGVIRAVATDVVNVAETCGNIEPAGGTATIVLCLGYRCTQCGSKCFGPNTVVEFQFPPITALHPGVETLRAGAANDFIASAFSSATIRIRAATMELLTGPFSSDCVGEFGDTFDGNCSGNTLCLGSYVDPSPGADGATYWICIGFVCGTVEFNEPSGCRGYWVIGPFGGDSLGQVFVFSDDGVVIDYNACVADSLVPGNGVRFLHFTGPVIVSYTEQVCDARYIGDGESPPSAADYECVPLDENPFA